jgi:AAA15 family ATPase/GTPase
MEMIKNLQINNYKSIKQLDLDCSRINVFVGRPNVGKSNILEALDLFSLSNFIRISNFNVTEKGKVNIKEYFRVNGARDLFHRGDFSNSILIRCGNFCSDLQINFNRGDQKNVFEWTYNSSKTEFDDNFLPSSKTKEYEWYYNPPNIEPYRFKEDIEFYDNNQPDSLMSPYGNNIARVITYNSGLQDLANDLTEDTGFEFVIDAASNQIYIQLRIKEGVVYPLKYQALADTFRRVLFYVAAIQTGFANVITLEEPEAHSFPPFTSMIADELIKASNKQFFIATHSPHLLNNLIENTPKEELSVFVCGYDKENFQTTAKKLSGEDLSELLDYGVDIFFNINRYLDDRVNHSS